jgi:hypothetical protein
MMKKLSTIEVKHFETSSSCKLNIFAISLIFDGTERLTQHSLRIVSNKPLSPSDIKRHFLLASQSDAYS